MAAVATESDRLQRREPRCDGSQAPAPRLFEPGGVTLEDLILGAWEDLVTEGKADCPVCGGSLSAAGGCESCGAELS